MYIPSLKNKCVKQHLKGIVLSLTMMYVNKKVVKNMWLCMGFEKISFMTYSALLTMQ
jgi:hypothetical protein